MRSSGAAGLRLLQQQHTGERHQQRHSEQEEHVAEAMIDIEVRLAERRSDQRGAAALALSTDTAADGTSNDHALRAITGEVVFDRGVP